MHVKLIKFIITVPKSSDPCFVLFSSPVGGDLTIPIVNLMPENDASKYNIHMCESEKFYGSKRIFRPI